MILRYLFFMKELVTRLWNIFVEFAHFTSSVSKLRNNVLKPSAIDFNHYTSLHTKFAAFLTEIEAPYLCNFSLHTVQKINLEFLSIL
jgi:hypothetical protein